MRNIIIKTEKLVHGGRALSFHDEKPVFVLNALPDEEVEVIITKKKSGYLEGTAVTIIKSSPDRITPKEDHHLSCSPWQIMKFEKENYWKEQITEETFQKLAGLNIKSKIIFSDQEYGYRNKIEYSFYLNDADEIQLAFFKRGSRGLNPIDKCLLAKGNTNKVALQILGWIKENKISRWDLKTLILRENEKGDVLGALFVKKEDLVIGTGQKEKGEGLLVYSSSEVERSREVHKTTEEFSIKSNNKGPLIGFKIYYSNPKSPASVPTKLIHTEGEDYLNEIILNKKFHYGVLSFFQVNIPLYEKVLAKISEFINKNDDIVDFYSGTGSIGICLSDVAKSGVLVETDEESGKFAEENLKLNNISNFASHVEPAEKMLEEIKGEKTIILDPPRAGLHPKVTEKLLEVAPPTIIYLSCDVATQARDLNLLKEKYDVKFNQIYNFFPRTPHIESLIILKKR